MTFDRDDLGFCQNVLNGVATPVIQISPDRTIQMINDAALEILALTREQAVGQKCHELFRTDDCDGGECATLRAMREKRKIESETVAHIRGKDIPIHYYASPLFNDSGEVIGAVEYFENLTEIKKKEDDLRRAGKEIQGVLNGVATPVIAIDMSQKITYINNAGADLFQKKPEDLIGTICHTLFQNDVCQGGNCATMRSIRERRVITEETVAHIGSRDIPILITATPIVNDEGVCTGAVEFIIDLTSQKAAIQDVLTLTRAAVEGRLNTRADASKHQGDFRKIVEGVNDTLDAVIVPLNVAAGYVDRISKGDIPEKITDTYYGDFNTIKNNLNQCIDAVNALVADANMLSKAAVEGRLNTRADTSKHQGDFRKIVEGVNDTLDAVIGPLNVAARYVDDISRGDIPAKITDNYNGDFNTIKNNLNQCIDAVNALVADANMLSKAAVEGRLNTRADASKHQGDFRKIVEGVNDTLDAVIGPLNVAARYVDDISRGDIPAKITDNYNGDFNTIKNNLNSCIDAVNALVADANMLSKAAVEGRLNTRADTSKHQGDFRKIVEGVNDTLDAVIGPLHDISAVLKRMAVNDYSHGIEKKYLGDFALVASDVNEVRDRVNHIANSIIQISNGDLSEYNNFVKGGKRSDEDILVPAFIKVYETLQALQNELIRLTEASKAGKLSERGNPDQFKGAYADVIRGMNQMLDEILIPIGEGNRILEQIRGGNLREKVEIVCHGDHEKMKNAINGVHLWRVLHQ